ncbi:hypothetical protein ACFELO_05120 [Oceanicaulis sp. LC35]|uniref:hypothetical protein n=1 Tax=Oceanicaulis sp. LC35 TaxID=3349635 RepID=UPI003F83A69D
MKLFDPRALGAAFRFVLDNPMPVLAAAGLYGVVFAVQSLLTAYAHAYAPGAAPGMILFMVAAFGAFVVGWASLARQALGLPQKGFYGLTLGGDEGRLAWALFLVLLLLSIILMTAGTALSFMIAGLAFTDMDPGMPQPEGYVNLFELMGPGALAISALLVAVFLVFSVWLITRLALTAPATIQERAVRVLSIWPLSRGRSLEIALTTLASLVPGVIVLALFNALSVALFGAGPAIARSAAGEAGMLTINPALYLVISAIYGVGKIALLAAPLIAMLCALYGVYKDEGEIPSE